MVVAQASFHPATILSQRRKNGHLSSRHIGGRSLEVRRNEEEISLHLLPLPLLPVLERWKIFAT
ncbi:MAG: hypothetical protein ACKO11_08815 [Cuspidothrix sp.]